MDTTLFIHIVAGAISLLAGYTAIYAAKGARLHRQSGKWFVYAMLVMSMLGLAMAALRGKAPELNIPAALLTAYLVITAFNTVCSASVWSRRIDRVAVVVAFGIGLFTFYFGIDAMSNGGKRNGMPAFVYFMFGTVALLAGIGDVRLLRKRQIDRTARLRRHLWRMCVALLFAAMSFFLGQADTIPAALRVPTLLSLPIVSVFLTMVFWLWRVRRNNPIHHALNVTV